MWLLPALLALSLAQNEPTGAGLALHELPDAGDGVAPMAPVAVADAGPPPFSFHAGPGEGVSFEAGDFKLQVRARVQVRASAVVPEADANQASRVNELLIRRARLQLRANYTKHLLFTLQLAFATLDMEADAPNVLRDAHLTWSWLRDLQVRAGQMKVPFGRQRVVSSSSLQLVDRAIATAELNLDRDVGVQLFSDDLFGLGNRFGYALGVFGGDGRNRLGKNPGLLYVVRLAATPFGKFDELVEGDFERSARPRLAIGLAAARNVETWRAQSTIGATYKLAPFTYEHLSADLMFKWRGLSVLLEGTLRKATEDRHSAVVAGATVTEGARSAIGWVAQTGYFFNEHLETTLRWSEVRPFAGGDPTLLGTRELGGGASWYFHKHDLKLQADYFVLSRLDFSERRHQLRLQVQLYF